MTKYTTEFIQKFCLKFDPDTKESCWEWTAGKNADGYGRIWNGCTHLRAHRVAYEIFVGDIPEGLHVRHKCDNRVCVNPHHLEVGTNADNVRDMVERGRQAKGSEHWPAKLCEPEVVLIKQFLARHPPRPGRHSGGQCDFIGRWFGVAAVNISQIHTKRIWTHVTVEKGEKQ